MAFTSSSRLLAAATWVTGPRHAHTPNPGLAQWGVALGRLPSGRCQARLARPGHELCRGCCGRPSKVVWDTAAQACTADKAVGDSKCLAPGVLPRALCPASPGVQRGAVDALSGTITAAGPGTVAGARSSAGSCASARRSSAVQLPRDTGTRAWQQVPAAVRCLLALPAAPPPQPTVQQLVALIAHQYPDDPQPLALGAEGSPEAAHLVQVDVHGSEATAAPLTATPGSVRGRQAGQGPPGGASRLQGTEEHCIERPRPLAGQAGAAHSLSQAGPALLCWRSGSDANGLPLPCLLCPATLAACPGCAGVMVRSTAPARPRCCAAGGSCSLASLPSGPARWELLGEAKGRWRTLLKPPAAGLGSKGAETSSRGA
ncbi:hypothetical protein HaLaN_13828 [Haematococcus lacustris]|uniref:Uncharacterized protein n=1 Tax=Haematococcus lacustris TaxID=44745 RepID=A0A699ZEA1_HAELA|nr:hypothetical protein HaLaN_13828 [Haematococcus lacustris]